MARPDRAPALSVPGSLADAALATPEPVGISHSVDLAVALPGAPVVMPIDVGADSAGLRYEWVHDGDSVQAALSLPMAGHPLYAPPAPGFYRLALVRDTQQLLLSIPVLGVMVPFDEKRGGEINGYRIGTYRGERTGVAPHPDGFLLVAPADTALPVSAHLRVGDFITHDQTDVWPKYFVLRTRLLDKLELVMAQLEQATVHGGSLRLDLNVHSGFRTPLYNGTVPRAVDDSRHEYGDAADVTLDANGDGRINHLDIDALVQAVDVVEADHPELAGGLGIYTGALYPIPYVHIDTRGEPMRWHD